MKYSAGGAVLQPESTRIQVADQVHVFVCINYIKNASWLLIVTLISSYVCLDLFVSSNHQNTHSVRCVHFPRVRI